MCLDGIGGRCAVLRQQRVGDAVGEGAVCLVMHFDEGDGDSQLLEAHFEFIDDMPCRTVARVNHQLERFDSGCINVGQQMIDIWIED